MDVMLRLTLSCFAMLVVLVMLPCAPTFAASGVVASGIVPHRAVYDIDLVATHSGSQVLNISGQMSYELKSTCGGWTTDHHFKLFYEYADSPGMRIISDFTTFEAHDGDELQFTSRRQRNGDMYQEIRGFAEMKPDKPGRALYSAPAGTKYDLAAGTLFPVAHTAALATQARAGKRFFNAQVFDGSDEDGPIEINAFIGKEMAVPKSALSRKEVDADLLKSPARNVRMAVFPYKDQEEQSDYEMSMLFHENGIISDMTIDYDDFSVRQSLTALEKLPMDSCDVAQEVPKKP